MATGKQRLQVGGWVALLEDPRLASAIAEPAGADTGPLQRAWIGEVDWPGRGVRLILMWAATANHTTGMRAPWRAAQLGERQVVMNAGRSAAPLRLAVRRAMRLPTVASAVGLLTESDSVADVSASVEWLVLPSADAECPRDVELSLLRHAKSAAGLVRDVVRQPVDVNGRTRSALRFRASPHDLRLLLPGTARRRSLADMVPWAASPSSARAFEVFRRAYVGADAAGVFVPWGLAPTPALQRDGRAVELVPVWRPWSAEPLARVDLERATRPAPLSMASTSAVSLVERSRSGGAAPGSANRSLAAQRFAVPFRMVASDRTDAPSLWLLNERAMQRVWAHVRMMRHEEMAGLSLGPVPDLSRWLVVSHQAAPPSWLDAAGAFAAMPGVPHAYAPPGWTVRPRLHPARLAAHFSVERDERALFVPRRLLADGAADDAGGSVPPGAGEPFDVIRVDVAKLTPLADVVHYSLEVTPRAGRSLPSAHVLDESLLAEARTIATVFHRGLHALRRVEASPAEAPSRVSGFSGMVGDVGQQALANGESITEAAEPEGTPLAAIEPVGAAELGEQRSSAGEKAARCRESELELQIGRCLAGPGEDDDAALASMWLELSSLKAERRRLEEALYAWASGAWLVTADGEKAWPASVSNALSRIAAAADPAEVLARVSTAEAARRIAGAGAEASMAEQAVWLLHAVARVRGDGSIDDTPTSVALQQAYRALSAHLPYKVRWLLATSLAAGTGDEMLHERERENILGELNTLGVARENLPPLVRRMLRRADASPAKALDGADPETDEVEPMGPFATGVGDAAFDWPEAALHEWTDLLLRIRSGAGFGGHGDTPLLLPLAEMLLTVSPDAAAGVPVATIREGLATSPATTLAAVLREHLADFDAAAEPSVARRVQAIRGVAHDEDPVESFASLPAALQRRLSTYLSLVSLSWAHGDVRAVWREYLGAQSVGMVLSIVAATPAAPGRWLTVLGERFLADELLPRIDASWRGYKRPAPGETAQALVVLDEVARIYERRDLPRYVPEDRRIDPDVAAAGRRCAGELFARVANGAPWSRDRQHALLFVDVLPRLRTLDAPALARLGDVRAPEGPRDTRWLDVTARLHVARARQLCAQGRRAEGLEVLQAVHSAWSAAFAEPEQRPGRGVLDSAGHLLHDVLSAVPATGSRAHGRDLVNACVTFARSVNDARLLAHVLPTAARALARLGEDVNAGERLAGILAAVDAGLRGRATDAFEATERVVLAALDLLPPAQADAHVLSTLRGWLGDASRFAGPDGPYFRLKTAILVRFAQWVLDPAATAVPRFDALMREPAAEGLLANDPLELAVYWAQWFLRTFAYEWEGSIDAYFETVGALLKPQSGGNGTALEFLRLPAAHVLDGGAAYDRHLRTFARREESRIRDRLA